MLALGNSIKVNAPTLVIAPSIPFVLTRRQAQDRVRKAYRRISSKGILRSTAAGGFTLLELLLVISIIAIASAGVSLAFLDSGQTALAREGDRLVALLEAARGQSRSTGQAIRWRHTPEGFRFEGGPGPMLAHQWLHSPTQVQWDLEAPVPALTLGPEPIIEARSITLVQGGYRLRISTDGLRPFAALPVASGVP